ATIVALAHDVVAGCVRVGLAEGRHEVELCVRAPGEHRDLGQVHAVDRLVVAGHGSSAVASRGWYPCGSRGISPRPAWPCRSGTGSRSPPRSYGTTAGS